MSKILGLHLLLKTYKVWVQHNRGKNLYLSLCSILQEDKPAIWSIEEIHKYKDKYSQFISGLINTRLRELKQAASPVVPIAVPPATPIAAPVAPAGTPTPLSPPAQYFYPSTAKDRLNYTLDGLAISPELAQPTATAITPPGTQTPTPTIS